MIETTLVFVLGALGSGLVALMLLPAFTRRAARLTRRDLEAQLPRSLDGIAALRDGVRAQYAARAARVQYALEATRRALTEAQLANGDTAIELAALRADQRDVQSAVAETEARLASAFASLRDREEALARAGGEIRDLDRRLRMAENRAQAAEDRIMEAERLTGEARLTLAATQAYAVALDEAARAAGLALPSHGLESTFALPLLQDTRFASLTEAPLPIAAKAEDPPRSSATPLTLSPKIETAIAARLRAARMIAQNSAPPSGSRPVPPAPMLPVAGSWTITAAPEDPPGIAATVLPMPPIQGAGLEKIPSIPTPELEAGPNKPSAPNPPRRKSKTPRAPKPPA